MISILGDILFFDAEHELHRDKGRPAFIRHNGDVSYYYHGQRHREGDLPSFYPENPINSEYQLYGLWHRTNGPAGYGSYYLYGILIPPGIFPRSVAVWKNFLTESNNRAIPCPEEWRKYYDENF